MRTFTASLALFILMLFVGATVPTPAHAQIGGSPADTVSAQADSTSTSAPAAIATDPTPSGPSIVLSSGVGTEYVSPDFTMFGSRHPHYFGSATATWNNGVSCGEWHSFGAGGTANEIDLFCSLAGSWGPVDYHFKVSPWILSGDGRPLFASFGDNGVYESFDFGHTFNFGRVSVGIHSKTQFFEGFKTYPFFAVEKIGVPVAFLILDRLFGSSDQLTGGVEFGRTFNLNKQSRSAWQLAPSLGYKITDSVSANVGCNMDYLDRHIDKECLVEVNWAVN